MKTPRSAWSSAGSTWSRRSPSWPRRWARTRIAWPRAKRGKCGSKSCETCRRASETLQKTTRTAAAGRYGREQQKAPKEVIKEGLSEYFIYTIEGTETIPNGWSKRLRSLEAAKVPVKIQYRYRPAEYGDNLVRMYLLTNDKESKLGTTPLPDGTFRLFRQNGHDGLSFLVAQAIKYIPIGDKIELNLGVRSGGDLRVGQAPDPARRLMDASARRRTCLERVDQPGVQVRVNSSVAGWDDHALFAQRLRNYTKKPIDVEIRRTFPGDVVFRSGLPAKNHDYRTVEYTAAVEAGAKAELHYEVVTHQGATPRQNRVVVEAVLFPVPVDNQGLEAR